MVRFLHFAMFAARPAPLPSPRPPLGGLRKNNTVPSVRRSAAPPWAPGPVKVTYGSKGGLAGILPYAGEPEA